MILHRNSYTVKVKVSVVEWEHQNEASVHRGIRRRSQACLWLRVVSMLQYIERTNPRSAWKTPPSTLWPTSVSRSWPSSFWRREAKADQCRTSFRNNL